MRSKALGSVITILLLFASVSCASGPVSIGSVPVYPDAKGLATEQNSLAGQVLQAMTASAEEQGLSSRFRLYVLPEGTSWDSVVAYYTRELDDSGWQPAPGLSRDSDVFTGLGWTRGRPGKEQSLLIVYVPELLADGAHLIVGVLTE
jgi:hypothetical protein